MLHGFFGVLRSMGHSSEFERYQLNLQENGLSGTPSVDEARAEYRARVQSTAVHQASIHVA